MESSYVSGGCAGSTSSSHTEAKHLADRLNAAQIKIKRLARLEATIVDLFMEIMERTADLPTSHSKSFQDTSTSDHDRDSAVARAKRKDELVRKAEGDPIALLNGLRTHLRVQLTAMEQQHHDHERVIAKLTTNGERHAQDAEDELRRWESACDASKQQLRAVAEQLRTAQDDHDRVTRQYKHSLELLNAELHALRATNDAQTVQLTKRQAEIDELTHANDVLRRERKRLVVEDSPTRCASHAKGSGSPTNIEASRGRGMKGLLAEYTPAEQQNLKRVLQDYEFKLNQLEAGNDELHEKLRRQQQHVASLRQSAQAQHCAKLEKDAKKLQETANQLHKRVADHEAELLRTRGALKERDARIQSMKDEYNKLFSALQKIKQPAGTQPRPLTRSASTASIGLKKSSTARNLAARADEAGGATALSNAELLRQEANENPYLLEHYKAKIEQQEKELLRMQTQLRKLIASEYRHKQKNKLFTAERGQLKDTCEELKGELERAVKTSAKAMAQQQLSRGMVDDSYDVKKPPSEPQGQDVASDGEDNDNDAGNCNGPLYYCSLSDVRRLRQRNLYLEERFRLEMDSQEPATGDDAQQISAAIAKDARPLLPSSSSRLGSGSSMASIPTLPLHSSHRSIDASTMQALQQVQRPQSASARAMLTLRPSVAIKSLL